MQFSEIQKLETIQRSFTSKIPALEGMDYWIRLSFLGLFSVQRRYEHLFKEKLDKYLFTIDDEPSVPGYESRIVCKNNLIDLIPRKKKININGVAATW